VDYTLPDVLRDAIMWKAITRRRADHRSIDYDI